MKVLQNNCLIHFRKLRAMRDFFIFCASKIEGAT